MTIYTQRRVEKLEEFSRITKRDPNEFYQVESAVAQKSKSQLSMDMDSKMENIIWYNCKV